MFYKSNLFFRIYLEAIDKGQILHIRDAKKEDSGTYSCYGFVAAQKQTFINNVTLRIESKQPDSAQNGFFLPKHS